MTNQTAVDERAVEQPINVGWAVDRNDMKNAKMSKGIGITVDDIQNKNYQMLLK